MASYQVFAIAELLEQILSCLAPHEILRLQSVCRKWKSLIDTSPTLLHVCWFTTPNKSHRETTKITEDVWVLNPCFERLNGTVKLNFDLASMYHERPRNFAQIDLTKLVYESPGSWAGMFATKPAAQYIDIECPDIGAPDARMFYTLQAQSPDGFRMGDIMAALAEIQNRQACGVDRWAGARHDSLRFWPWDPYQQDVEPPFYDFSERASILKELPDNVDLKVVVEQAWDAGEYPAFSLKRLNPMQESENKQKSVVRPSDGSNWAYEMIVHEMYSASENHLYVWDHWGSGKKDETRYLLRPLYKEGKYEAKMLYVKEHSMGYLQACQDVFKLVES